MDGDVVFYKFSRAKVERGDFGHFLGLYAPAKLPAGRRLRKLMNSLIFLVEGFDDDPREIYAIPEIRQFYSAFHDAWPYWLYFCNVETDALRTMALCCLSSIAAVKIDQRPNVAVEYDRLQILDFISKDFGPMNSMCDRAEMHERGIFDRTKAVFACFDLPFHAEPPP